MSDSLRDIIGKLSLSRSEHELDRALSQNYQQLKTAIASATDDQLVRARSRLGRIIHDTDYVEDVFMRAHWQEVEGLIVEAQQKRAQVSSFRRADRASLPYPCHPNQLSIILRELASLRDVRTAADARSAEINCAIRDASNEGLLQAHKQLQHLLQHTMEKKDHRAVSVWLGLGNYIGCQLHERGVTLPPVSPFMLGGGIFHLSQI